MRRLIVNADDFGLTNGINSAILKANLEGIVTSTTLMANGSAFDQAVSLTASAPSLSIGCHVMLVDGSSLLQPARVATLLAGRDSTSFCRSAGALGWRSMPRGIDTDQMVLEAVAHIRTLQVARSS